MFLPRSIRPQLEHLLGRYPAVALLGPRQVGKTTLARYVADTLSSIYLDLESPADRAKLSDPELYLSRNENRLVVLDEIHRAPGIFQILRGLIDNGRRRGLKSRRFLLLGSASIELLRQSGESLAGRIAFLELTPFLVSEVGDETSGDLWLKGGFPDSFLAESEALSLEWREFFIRTYLERDIPQLGPRIPAETLRRFWTMLAHSQGGLLNASSLARGLSVDGKTIARYLDLLVDLLLVRRLRPWHGNPGKRLVKSPRLYVRDSGIVHALLRIESMDDLLGHPVVGPSWEGFVLENLLTAAPKGTDATFYRSSGGAEIDLVLTLPGRRPWAIEIKRSHQPRPERGFYHACEDVEPEKRYVVYPGDESFPLSESLMAVSVRELVNVLESLT